MQTPQFCLVVLAVAVAAPSGCRLVEILAGRSPEKLADSVVSGASSPEIVSEEATRPVGKIAHFAFDENDGDIARDTSGFGDPVALEFSGGVHWLREGQGVRLDGGEGKLVSANPEKLHQRITATGRFSIEMWLRPTMSERQGSDILVGYAGAEESNLTLWADRSRRAGGNIHVHLRTSETDLRGNPEIVANEALVPHMQHVVVTYDGETVQVYRDAMEVVSKSRPGNLNWDASLPLVFGNRMDGRHGWRGEICQIVVYDRELTPMEVTENHQNGWWRTTTSF